MIAIPMGISLHTAMVGFVIFMVLGLVAGYLIGAGVEASRKEARHEKHS